MLYAISIDDDPQALATINAYARYVGDMRVQGYADAVEGIVAVNECHPDVVFMETEVGDRNCVELARRLPADVCVVFTTASKAHAAECFEVGATDYLPKPFAIERFAQAVEKVRQRMQFLSYSNASDTIVLMANYHNVRIKADSIVYVEAHDKHVCLYMDSGEAIESRMQMDRLLRLLPTGRFIRIHRSYAVPVRRIVSYTYSRVIITGVERPLPVGRTFASRLRDASCLLSHSL